MDNAGEMETGAQLSTSNHLPIYTPAKVRTTHQPIFNREAKWKQKKANWPDYREEIEEKLVNLPDSSCTISIDVSTASS